MENLIKKLDLNEYITNFSKLFAREKSIILEGDINIHYKIISELSKYNINQPLSVQNLDSQLMHLQKQGVLRVYEIYEFIKIINYFLYLTRFNFEGKLFEWMDKTLEDRDFPAIIIRDSSSKVSDQSLLEHFLKIEVDIATKGKNSPWNMREVSSDVLKVFRIVEETLNFKINYLGFESLVEQRESMYSGTRMEFEIIYHSRRFEQ